MCTQAGHNRSEELVQEGDQGRAGVSLETAMTLLRLGQNRQQQPVFHANSPSPPNVDGPPPHGLSPFFSSNPPPPAPARPVVMLLFSEQNRTRQRLPSLLSNLQWGLRFTLKDSGGCGRSVQNLCTEAFKDEPWTTTDTCFLQQ